MMHCHMRVLEKQILNERAEMLTLAGLALATQMLGVVKDMYKILYRICIKYCIEYI